MFRYYPQLSSIFLHFLFKSKFLTKFLALIKTIMILGEKFRNGQCMTNKNLMGFTETTRHCKQYPASPAELKYSYPIYLLYWYLPHFPLGRRSYRNGRELQRCARECILNSGLENFRCKKKSETDFLSLTCIIFGVYQTFLCKDSLFNIFFL